MAIDYGRVRTGIALSDPSGVIAQPYQTIITKSQKALLQRLKCIIEENNVQLVILGNPISLTGRATEMGQEVLKFARHLERMAKVRIKLWDERFTSLLAVNLLKDYNLKSKNTDQIVASLILEDYLKNKNEI